MRMNETIETKQQQQQQRRNNKLTWKERLHTLQKDEIHLNPKNDERNDDK